VWKGPSVGGRAGLRSLSIAGSGGGSGWRTAVRRGRRGFGGRRWSGFGVGAEEEEVVFLERRSGNFAGASPPVDHGGKDPRLGGVGVDVVVVKAVEVAKVQTFRRFSSPVGVP
jgi:hypothetical protein